MRRIDSTRRTDYGSPATGRRAACTIWISAMASAGTDADGRRLMGARAAGSTLGMRCSSSSPFCSCVSQLRVAESGDDHRAVQQGSDEILVPLEQLVGRLRRDRRRGGVALEHLNPLPCQPPDGGGVEGERTRRLHQASTPSRSHPRRAARFPSFARRRSCADAPASPACPVDQIRWNSAYHRLDIGF